MNTATAARIYHDRLLTAWARFNGYEGTAEDKARIAKVFPLAHAGSLDKVLRSCGVFVSRVNGETRSWHVPA